MVLLRGVLDFFVVFYSLQAAPVDPFTLVGLGPVQEACKRLSARCLDPAHGARTLEFLVVLALALLVCSANVCELGFDDDLV